MQSEKTVKFVNQELAQQLLEVLSKDLRKYRKTVRVRARRAIQGEYLETRLQSGLTETSKILVGDEIVITNPLGESYAICAERFKKLYQHIESDIFQARGVIYAFPNPFRSRIFVKNPNEHHGDADCWIAYPSDSPELCYLIGHREFVETYESL